MTTLATLQVTWFILIGVLITGYFVLDGFDLGAGILSKILAKNETETRILVRSVGPVWDGNEVWLLTAGGALFAAFAPAYATSFSGFYLAIMLVLFALIIRAISIEFMSLDPKWGKLWGWLFLIGSAIAALLFGVALGNIIQGIPLNKAGDYTGTFFGLLGIFPLLCGVLSLLHIMWQGASWIALKTEVGSAIYMRAITWRRGLAIATAAAFVLATGAFFFFVSIPMQDGIVAAFRIVFVALFVIGMVASLAFMARKTDLGSFLSAGVTAVSLVGIWATSTFPNLIYATNDPSLSLTIWNSSSSELGLTCMTIIACIGVPLVLLYHVIVYRTYKGRITTEDTTSY
jgi:cytochrome bd ubiquinol oxidase subunit II